MNYTLIHCASLYPGDFKIRIYYLLTQQVTLCLTNIYRKPTLKYNKFQRKNVEAFIVFFEIYIKL
jgi:hypothetical protein